MAPTTEALLILFLLALVKYSVSLSLGGRSIRLGKYRLRPIMVYRESQPEYTEEDPFSYYPDSAFQESSYPEYDYYSGGKQPDYESFAQLYDKNDNYIRGLEQNAAAYLRPVTTMPPATTLSTYEMSSTPKPTPTVHRFNRGQKEFPMLRPPTESRRSVRDDSAETYGIIKNFESTRIKPAEKNFADLLSAELEHLKPRAH